MEYDFLPIDDDLDEIDEDDTAPKRGRLFTGDSWFGSVKCVANIKKMGCDAIMQVKTAHSRCPKEFLENEMKDMPGGTWITMEGRAEKEEVDLVCVGYKYNKSKVLVFVTSKGAGSTAPGEPYEGNCAFLIVFFL